MFDPSRSENEGRIGLQRTLPKNWGLHRTLKNWKDDDVYERYKKMVSLYQVKMPG